MAMQPQTLTIGGQALPSAQFFDVIDPASGKAFAQAPAATVDEVQRAVVSAERAFHVWRRDEAARRSALVAAADAIAARAEALARLLTREQGKPLRFAQREVMGLSATFRYYARLPIPVDVTHADENTRIEIRRRPYGVVAAVTPWNFPLLIAGAKLAPALLAGNTVVLKPSPYTPLSSLELGTILNAVLPAGVVNVVSGDDSIGRVLTEHPLVRKISFTGSVATGKKVAAVAAQDLKRVTLELGGNDPAIVMSDVDPTKIARSLFWAAFTNSGQVCTAVKRLYVHRDVYQQTVAALLEVVRGMQIGSGLDAGSDIGPLNNAPQYRRIKELFEDAMERGASAHGNDAPRPGRGYFFAPTLLTDVSEDARVVAEEQFGPLLPILPFDDVDEVIARANATHFGLSGSVWTNDVERGQAIAAELECGTAWVNQHIAFSPAAPFGGAKWSGIGYENGPWGLDGFCQLQALNIKQRLDG